MEESRKHTPTLCVVTPSFNQAQFLEQTITSVLGQQGRGSLFDLQYAVVDGGSRDGSADIIRKYAGDLHYWCSESDRGQSHAINKGFSRLDGDLYAYMNSDDYFLPGAFARMVEAWRARPEADLFHGTCEKVDADGQTLGHQLSDITSLSEIVDLWNHWLFARPNRNFIQPEVFWTRRMTELVGPFDEQLFYTMDFDFWLRGFDAGIRVATVDGVLAAFRVHAAQKTTARNASILELLDRVQPYLEGDDPRILSDHRREMQRHSRMTRRIIASADCPPEQRVLSMISLAREEPGLLGSPLYWRHLRRNGKRVFWKRDAA